MIYIYIYIYKNFYVIYKNAKTYIKNKTFILCELYIVIMVTTNYTFSFSKMILPLLTNLQ